MGKLTNLRELGLYGQLSGEIPLELGNLINLQELFLSGNQLSGEVPPELGNLVNLHTLVLEGIRGEIPPEIGNLVCLQSLSLSGGQLSGEIPPELGNLVNLISLQLYGQLEGCVSRILSWNISLKSERYYTLYNVHLPLCTTENTEDIGALAALATRFKELAPLLTRDAPPIYELEGVFTDASGRVVGLGLENVGYLPPELGNLSNLRYLRLNGVQGEIPPELGNLTTLTSLQLYGNSLTGEIPPELGNLTNLRLLSLAGDHYGRGASKSNLGEEIPSELGNLTNLTSLYLDGWFDGEIPPELGNLTNLTSLHLEGRFEGEIPTELGNLTNLRELYLSGRCIPASPPPFLEYPRGGEYFCPP